MFILSRDSRNDAPDNTNSSIINFLQLTRSAGPLYSPKKFDPIIMHFSRIVALLIAVPATLFIADASPMKMDTTSEAEVTMRLAQNSPLSDAILHKRSMIDRPSGDLLIMEADKTMLSMHENPTLESSEAHVNMEGGNLLTPSEAETQMVPSEWASPDAKVDVRSTSGMMADTVSMPSEAESKMKSQKMSAEAMRAGTMERDSMMVEMMNGDKIEAGEKEADNMGVHDKRAVNLGTEHMRIEDMGTGHMDFANMESTNMESANTESANMESEMMEYGNMLTGIA